MMRIYSVKGHYWVKDFAMDGNKCPPIFMSGHWKTELKIFKKNMIIVVINLYWKRISGKVIGL